MLNCVNTPAASGWLSLSWNHRGRLSKIEWFTEDPGEWTALYMPPSLQRWIACIDGYFQKGKPIGALNWDEIDDSTWTQFQREVYRAIAQIPHGETRTYGWVAEKIGRPLATRAVGQALRSNPLPILIPCHRVVGASGLGGFMGMSDLASPELLLKRALITVEDEYLNPVFPFLVRIPETLLSVVS